MAEQVKKLSPPRGFSRLMFRAPIWLYRLRLGFLMRGRMLLLTHTGRKSGLERKTVLEVVQHNPQDESFIVAVGFGKKSQWYQNLKANPHAKVDGGWGANEVTAKELSADEGAAAFVDFTRRNPGEAKFAHLLGFEVDGTEADFFEMGKQMTFIKLAVK